MIRFRAWPRADGMVEVEAEGVGFTTGLPWRGSPADADVFLAGLRAGLDLAMRATRDAAAWEGQDNRPIRPAPPPAPERCTCQAYPTHCANDCPLHGLEEE